MNRRSIKSDLKKLDSMKERDIDCSDIPELDESFFAKQTVTIPPRKEQLTVRFDQDVVAWFRAHGRGYQTRMNAVLRAYVDAQKESSRRRPD